MMLVVDRRKRARLELLERVGDCDAHDELASSAPRGFICPLTMEVMFDPVLDAEGNTYERSSLLKWLEHNQTSPVSRQPLNDRMIIANNAMRDTIHEYMGAAWVQQRKAERENEPHGTQNSEKIPSRMRSKIDCFLRNTCNELGGLDLKLDADGCCAFRYDTITIVLDVPDQVGVFCLYTKDLLQGNGLDQDKLCRRAMELNFLQGTARESCLRAKRQLDEITSQQHSLKKFIAGDTRGGCLSVRRHSGRQEIMFSYTDRIPEVSSRDFSNILLNFVETSMALRDKLMKGMEQPQWWEDEGEVVEDEVDACDKRSADEAQTSAEQTA